ncbi:hypothetical protein F5884DRAFT_887734 [Xylogone sp. PMI_703]|nr:hypothetical protein F5884DRAFT_887734 [Xylogone sp. PMI_703]
MYSDLDSTTTKQSQAVYNCRIRRLLFTTSPPLTLGFFAAALNNKYTGKSYLFGSTFNEKRYKKILIASVLPKGNKTQISLQNVKLNGNQRVKLALSRALYSNAQLLVLNNICPALDFYVSLCLLRTMYIVRIENNTISYAGDMESIKEELDIDEIEGRIPQLAAEEKLEGPHDKKITTKPASKKAKSFHAHTDVKLYATYFIATRGLSFFLIYLLGLVSKQLLDSLTIWLLGRVNTTHYPKVAITLKFLFNVHAFSSTVRGTKTLFREITFIILRMPLQWLGSNPIREMLKKFTIDITRVDEVLVSMSEFADCFVRLMIIITFDLYTSMSMSFLTVDLLFWCAQVINSYLNARSMVRRADIILTANIFVHFPFTTARILTIRAFGAVKDPDDSSRHSIVKWVYSCLFLGILFTLGTGIIVLLPKSVINTSLLGFVLTFSMDFSWVIFKAVDKFGALETFMDATREDWPSKGEVEVKHLDVPYSADFSLVLKDVSFTVIVGTRIGIISRTGARKSFLALLLLCLLEPHNGSILIDSLDISTIKLQVLRSRIAFIPQDSVLFSETILEEKLTEVIRRVNLLGDEKDGLFTLNSPISAGGTNMLQDEATSAIDNKTDLLIQDTIRTEFSRTLIVVAHRLRTVAPFDQIMVMSDGKVAKIGPSAQLLRDKGFQDKEFLMGTILK